MQFSTLLTGLAGLALSEALTMKSVSSGFMDPRFSSSQEGKALCVNGYIPVKASGDNLKINMQEPPNGSVITQGFVDMFSTGSKFLSEVVGGPSKVSGTYNIYSQLCYPVKGINAKTIQVLTHGVGFDHTYWDVAPGYSYIDAAAEKGYTTFSYDRLGVGYSETPDSLQVVQAPLESGILYALIEMLRGGKLANTKFQNVVGVGHSFGSAVTVGVAHLWPTAMDAAVLTGFSTDMSALPVFLSALNLEIASRADHTRFASLAKDHGYLVAATITGNQFDFFHEPGYPPENLRIAELTKGTVTLGELLTMTAVGKPATKFTGPIDVVNGEYDLPFCYGNCHLPSNLAAKVQPALFPKASKKSTTYLAKAAGHGLNLHYSATDAYAQIMSFMSGNGL